jgi:hypothetical protein
VGDEPSHRTTWMLAHLKGVLVLAAAVLLQRLAKPI